MKKEINFKKKYGQNFLTNNKIINNIVSSVNPDNNNLVIEVGPGAGALTKCLAMKFDNVLAYEIDQDLEEILYDNLKNDDNVKIIFDDFIKRDISKDIAEYNAENIYFIANLPYYITTPIVNKIISLDMDIKNIVIMIQKEVADRFCAKVGTKEYNSLTVFLNYFYDIKRLFVVSRNNFNPVPNVDSAVVMMNLKNDRLHLKDKFVFFKLVRDSFQFKRKNLKNNLKNYDLDKINDVLKRHDMDLTTRAEKLSLEIFVEIANSLI
ncbi:MAG: 16S rRNA (adenine(1518)-N(6)/adenine(1519)-N(6))-dimethyltransferase RsmA [Bacilli bacterium]